MLLAVRVPLLGDGGNKQSGVMFAIVAKAKIETSKT